MTVAQWHDLAVYFVDGAFVGFVYDYKGWHSSTQISPLRPPAGAKLTPLLEADGGITVGDIVAPPKSLSFETANGEATLSGAGCTDSVSWSIAPYAEKRSFVVTSINVVMGNCGE